LNNPVREYPLKKIPDNMVIKMMHTHSREREMFLRDRYTVEELRRYNGRGYAEVQLTDGDVVDLKKGRKIAKARTCIECGDIDNWTFRMLRPDEHPDARFVKIVKVVSPNKKKFKYVKQDIGDVDVSR